MDADILKMLLPSLFGDGMESLSKLVQLRGARQEQEQRAQMAPYALDESAARAAQMQAATGQIPFNQALAEREMAGREGAWGLDERQLEFLRQKQAEEMAMERQKWDVMGPFYEAMAGSNTALGASRIQRIMNEEAMRRKWFPELSDEGGEEEALPQPQVVDPRFQEWLRSRVPR